MELLVLVILILGGIATIAALMIYKMITVGNRLHAKFNVWLNR